jgi:hypothetical protein
MIEVTTKRGQNGHTFCNNACAIVEEAEKQGLTRADIARIANVDPRTVAGWVRVNAANYKVIRPLVEYLNKRGTAGGNAGQIFPVSGSAVTNENLPSPLVPDVNASVSDVLRILAPLGLTLEIVKIPAVAP